MNQNEKIAKIMLIILGGANTINGLWGLLVLAFTIFMGIQSPFKFVWGFFMPFFFIIGLAYLFFGINFNKIKVRKLMLLILISSIAIVWLLFYTIAVTAIPLYPKDISGQIIPATMNIIFYFTLSESWVTFIVPQIIIGINLYRAEKKNKDTLNVE
jgi:hypothetical protein